MIVFVATNECGMIHAVGVFIGDFLVLKCLLPSKAGGGPVECGLKEILD